MKLQICLLVALSVASSSGCIKTDLPPALRSVDESIRAIGNDLGNGLADFTTTAHRLSAVLKGLPREIAAELRIALEQVAQRSLQGAGIEARCVIDFARQR